MMVSTDFLFQILLPLQQWIVKVDRVLNKKIIYIYILFQGFGNPRSIHVNISCSSCFHLLSRLLQAPWSQINLCYRSNMGSYWAKRDRNIQVSQATNPVTKRVHRFNWIFFCFSIPQPRTCNSQPFFVRTTIPPKWKPVHLSRVRHRPNLTFDGPPSFCVGETWLANWTTLSWRTGRAWMKW